MRVLIVFSLVLALLTGCSGTVLPAGEQSPQASLSGAEEASMPEEAAAEPQSEPVAPGLWDGYSVVIDPLVERNLIDKSWKAGSVPESHQGDNWYYPYKITEVVKLGDVTQITLECHYQVILNTETMQEQRFFTEKAFGVEVLIEGDGPFAPMIPIGKSVVTARRTDFGWDYLSCRHTPYESPGASYLGSVTESIAAQLAASEKPDLSACDPAVVRHVHKKLAARRLIRSPDDITMYDLGVFLKKFDFYDMASVPSAESEPAVVESSILRLMTGLTEFGSHRKLSDYGVFEDMNNLNRLYLYSPDDEAFASLRVGGVKYLHLIDADADIADLSGVKNLDTLIMQSWFAGVRSFKGCEQINTLFVSSTRTDPRLYNPENFPGVKRIVIDSYRDYPRAVDYSRLAEFEGVDIDVQLQYYACDDAAVGSLAGVKLRRLYLTPEDGGPRTDFDRSLVDALDAEELYLNEYANFGEEFYDYH